MTDELTKLLRDAYGERVTVRVTDGRLVCAGPGSTSLGQRLRAAAPALREELGDWDRYVTDRLREVFREVALDYIPAVPSDDEWRAIGNLEQAALTDPPGGDAAQYEAMLWQYQLVMYRDFRAVASRA